MPGSTGGAKPVVTVGEFVNQDWPAYIDMANYFLSGLTLSTERSHTRAPYSGPPIRGR